MDQSIPSGGSAEGLMTTEVRATGPVVPVVLGTGMMVDLLEQGGTWAVW